jgi:hypothetical protein
MPASTHNWSDTLQEVVCATLENLAFTEMRLKPQPEFGQGPESYLGAGVPLGKSAVLEIFASRELLLEIASVLYSPGPEGLDPGCLPDTLAEVLNIIGGRFLEAIVGGRSDFTMGLPRPVESREGWTASPVRMILVTESGQELAVSLDPDGLG